MTQARRRHVAAGGHDVGDARAGMGERRIGGRPRRMRKGRSVETDDQGQARPQAVAAQATGQPPPTSTSAVAERRHLPPPDGGNNSGGGGAQDRDDRQQHERAHVILPGGQERRQDLELGPEPRQRRDSAQAQ